MIHHIKTGLENHNEFQAILTSNSTERAAMQPHIAITLFQISR